MKPEIRSYKAELRAVKGTDGAQNKLSGMAALYGILSRDLGGWRERIVAGAFARSVSENNIKAFWNHNSDHVLGSRKSGSLSVSDTPQGISFDLTAPSWAEPFLAQVAAGDVEEMSFGFIPLKSRWIIEQDGQEETLIRELLDVDLLEISPVAIPAYPMTSVGLRDFFNTEDLSAIKAQVKAAAPVGDAEPKDEVRQLSPAERRMKTILR
jgi:uncharacterized protein